MRRLLLLLAVLLAFPAHAITPGQRVVVTGAFNPAQVFPTLWYDPSDLSVQYSDSACTTPATVGGTDGCLKNKGNAGGSQVQATSGNRPTLTLSSGLYYLAFNGTSSSLASGTTINLSAASSLGVCYGYTPTNNSPGIIAEFGPNANSTNLTFSLDQSGNVAGDISFEINSGGQSAVHSTLTTFGSGITSVVSSPGLDITKAGSTLNFVMRRNGTPLAITTVLNSGVNGTFYSTQTLYVGARAGTSAFAATKLYGIILRATPFGSIEMTRVEKWLGRKAGLAF